MRFVFVCVSQFVSSYFSGYLIVFSGLTQIVFFNLYQSLFPFLTSVIVSGGPLLLGSSVGGTSIEEIAEKHPEAIIKHPINVFKGLSEEEAHDFAKKLGFTKEKAKEAAESIRRLYKMFIERDCLLVEVNPFAETHDGRVLLCDAKVNFDDNADFRQKDIFELRDESQSDPREVIASHYNLNYVGLDGNIGCMVRDKYHCIAYGSKGIALWISKDYPVFHFFVDCLDSRSTVLVWQWPQWISFNYMEENQRTS